MYAVMRTRLDIAFVTSTVVQFCDNPGWARWEAVKRIYRYLKGTKDLVLTYGGDNRRLLDMWMQMGCLKSTEEIGRAHV